MSLPNIRAFAKKLYFEDDFYLLVCRDPASAIAIFGSDAFDDAEKKDIHDFAARQTYLKIATINQLGGGHVINIGNGCTYDG